MIVYLALAAVAIVGVVLSVCRRLRARSADYPIVDPPSHVAHHPGPYDQHKEGT